MIAMRIGSATVCCSAATTTVSLNIPKVATCGTLKMTAASLDVPLSDLVVKERALVSQVNTRSARLGGTLLGNLGELSTALSTFFRTFLRISPPTFLNSKPYPVSQVNTHSARLGGTLLGNS